MSLLKTGRPSINKAKAFQELKLERTETLTIMIPSTLKKDLKVKAIRNETTVTDLILNYIKRYIEEDNK